MRTIRLVVAAALALGVGVLAVALARVVVPDSAVRGPSTSEGAGGVLAGGEAPAGAGPAAGLDVADYVAEADAALAAASGERVAVVSFTSYRTAADAAHLVAAAAGTEVLLLAHLVAAPGDVPILVDASPGGLATWASERRQAVQVERDEVAGLLPTVEEGGEFAAFYAEELERFDALLAGLDPAGEVVHGLVVRADAEVLRSIAAGTGVRLVDVAASSAFDPDDGFAGLRPEENRFTGDPPLRPT